MPQVQARMAATATIHRAPSLPETLNRITSHSLLALRITSHVADLRSMHTARRLEAPEYWPPIDSGSSPMRVSPAVRNRMAARGRI